MPTRLKRGERCPIVSHRGSRTCCGRGELPARAAMKMPIWKLVGPGTRQYPDGHIERSPAALAKRKKFLLERGTPCAACHETFDDFREVELAHIESKGSAGWKRNDDLSNLVLMHKSANRAQGSLSLEIYLTQYWKPEHCQPQLSTVKE